MSQRPQQKRIVISGGQCSGKTTLINELKKRGFYVVPEAPMYLIERRDLFGEGVFPWENLEKFQESVFFLQDKWEKEIPPAEEIVFLDRGVFDPLAYFEASKRALPKHLRNFLTPSRYSHVFFLDLLPRKYWGTTLNGSARVFSYEESLRIRNILWNIYQQAGISLTVIPVCTVAQRADIIEQQLGISITLSLPSIEKTPAEAF